MTTLVKWAPFGDLDTAERRMRRMLEDFGVASNRLAGLGRDGDDKELIVKLDHRASTRRARSRSRITPSSSRARSPRRRRRRTRPSTSASEWRTGSSGRSRCRRRPT